MTDRELEQRLRATALALDARAPAFDAAPIAAPRRARVRRALAVAACAALVAGVIAEPAALSAVARFLGVTSVDELAPVAPDVAPPFLGREVSRDAAGRYVGFRIREVGALGDPERFHGRDDLAGGMVSVSYQGGLVLTQWHAGAVDAGVEVTVSGGSAEDVMVGERGGVWVAGEARGTFVVVGADGARHREEFAVREGALAWEAEGVGFLLQGASSSAEAARLAASVR